MTVLLTVGLPPSLRAIYHGWRGIILPTSEAPTTEVQVAPVNAAPSQEAVPQLPHHKVKIKKPLQRSCNEKDAKGKLCGGHLKRWFYWLTASSRSAVT